MRFWRLVVVLTIVASTPFWSGIAQASTYSFSGACADCTGSLSGTSQVTATLVLINDLVGQPLDPSNFVSFSYDGSDKQGAFSLDPNTDSITFSATFADQASQFAAVTIQGVMNQQTTDPSNGDTGNQRFTFTTGTDGSFNLAVDYLNDSDGSSGPTGVSNNLDEGTNATWTAADATAVPEMPSVWLLGAAAGALALARRLGLRPNTQQVRNRVGEVRAIQGVEVELVHPVCL